MNEIERLKALLKTAREALKTITDSEEFDGSPEEHVTAIEDATEAVRSASANLDAEVAKQAERDEIIEAAKEAAKSVLAEIPNSNRGGIHAPNLKNVSKPGFSNDEGDAFMHYMRTGDIEAIRGVKASNVNPLEGVTDAQGAVTVPDDFYEQIVAKRNEMSIVRQAGATVIQTTLDKVNIPVELVGHDVFAITAQEAAIDEDDPTFANVAVDVYRFTKLVKASVELIADEKANLTGFLTQNVAGAMALTENQYALVGTGSSQPQGVYVGGTAGLTAASATTIATGEVPELFYKLPAEYVDTAVWTMANATLGDIVDNVGSDFQFSQDGRGGDFRGPTLWNHPVLLSAKNAALGASAKTAVFGNWGYYALVERQGLQVQRLVELYAGNGQIGFSWSYRQGGAVLQAEAFQYLTMASA